MCGASPGLRSSGSSGPCSPAGDARDGSGTSTIVFAARGADHEAVTPAAEEAPRIVEELRRRQIPADRIRFHVGSSDEVLPGWDARPLDLVLLDGAHGFPYPVLDWWYLAPHLKPGGLLLLDDAYMAGVSALLDYLRSRPSWRVEDAVGYRSVVVRKVQEERPPFDSLGEEGVRHVSFGYLPPHRRAVASARHRIFSTRPGSLSYERRGSTVVPVPIALDLEAAEVVPARRGARAAARREEDRVGRCPDNRGDERAEDESRRNESRDTRSRSERPLNERPRAVLRSRREREQTAQDESRRHGERDREAEKVEQLRAAQASGT